MKIVVIEDEIRIREGICKLISKINPEHIVVGQADNGEDGFEIILNKDPDLVITDIKMPMMDGLGMLKTLQNKKMSFKTIVLSAYSEFVYAQQAILLGVNEFLIKPIAVNDLTRSLYRIEKLCEFEKKMSPDILNSLESIYRGILFGGVNIDNNLLHYIEEKYNMHTNTIFALVYFCFDKNNDGIREVIKKKIEPILEKISQLQYHLMNTPDNKGMIMIVHGFDAERKTMDPLQKTLETFRKDRQNANLNIGWSISEGPLNLKSAYNKLSQSMEWGIVLGDVVIDSSRLSALNIMPSFYPIKIENEIKSSLCASYDFLESKRLVNEFITYYKDKMYDPKEIKADYIRFVWMLINISKQIGIIDYEMLNARSVIERINDATSYTGIQRELEDLFALIKTLFNNTEFTTSLTVNRAKSLIHEFHHTGITLDEIANKLSITPEYLSTLFRDKTGINFTTYFRNYRINKAKELLIRTELKLYEIAEKVGYSDPKYFSRVFRGCTGWLPDEYRKINK